MEDSVKNSLYTHLLFSPPPAPPHLILLLSLITNKTSYRQSRTLSRGGSSHGTEGTHSCGRPTIAMGRTIARNCWKVARRRIERRISPRRCLLLCRQRVMVVRRNRRNFENVLVLVEYRRKIILYISCKLIEDMLYGKRQQDIRCAMGWPQLSWTN